MRVRLRDLASDAARARNVPLVKKEMYSTTYLIFPHTSQFDLIINVCGATSLMYLESDSSL